MTCPSKTPLHVINKNTGEVFVIFPRCGRWACPQCGPARQRAKARDVEQMIFAAQWDGLSVGYTTLTLYGEPTGEDVRDRLARLTRALRDAFPDLRYARTIED
jgi:hypothetical protein